MTPRKRKLWDDCVILFKKYNIQFENSEEREDAIENITYKFLDNVDILENIIIDKYNIKQQIDFSTTDFTIIEEQKQEMVDLFTKETQQLDIQNHEHVEQFEISKKKGKRGNNK